MGLAYPSPKEMCFGVARYPVTCGYGVSIGGGEVLPEVNFTLPTMEINEETLPEVRRRYREIVRRVLGRAVQLGQASLVLEFEHLYELTRNPDWGALITADIKKVMDEFYQREGLKTALRVTVADIRDEERPPRMRGGRPLGRILRAFEGCADAGADILSIESTGGKEVFDKALIEGDLFGITFALGVLAPSDMAFLWRHIVSIADRYGVIAGGDTACGFANTAMQLAHQGLLPKVLAAIIRLMSIPRSLVAIRVGAKGPLKDCGYENPAIKAIAGVPISMEGKTSACAHSSPLGNIAACVCDLWSNESVQDLRLLGGYAPEVFTEILIYDCRLMNTARQRGVEGCLQELFLASDRNRDPQALVLDLKVMHEGAKRVISERDDYARTLSMVRFALDVLHDALKGDALSLSTPERRWLERLGEQAAKLPDDPEELRHKVEPNYHHLFLPSQYGLESRHS